MMEEDSVHFSLEKHFSPPIYTSMDYINRLSEARKIPYIIHHLDFTLFQIIQIISN